MNFTEALNILKEEIEILEEEKKSGSPLKNGSEPSAETKKGCTGGEPGCDTKNEKIPAVKSAEMPEVSAMVSTILKKNKIPAEAVIKLARPIASTILAFEKKNSDKDLNDFDAGLYSKLCSDFEKISALKDNADDLADKIVDAYHNC